MALYLVALYLVACAAVTLVAVLAYGETRTRDLAADDAVEPADRRSTAGVQRAPHRTSPP